MPEIAAADRKLDFSSRSAARHVDRMLDDAVEDSFPASDPVSLAMPHERVRSSMDALRQVPMPSMGTMLIAGGALLAVIALLALRK